MSLKKQLERYKKHLTHEKDMSGRKASLELKEQKASDESGAVSGTCKKMATNESESVLNQALQVAATDLGAEIRSLDDQALLQKKIVYPLEERHGHYRFADLYEAAALWETNFQDHPLSARSLEPEDLLFFDTETTGLGAGAGHMIFLLGTGKVVGKQFEVTQYFLPGPGHEAAFYYYFLSDNRDLSNLVTFNGKAFDWPRVKTRVQFVRDRVPKLPEYGHFDLLHASRRLWKHRLESVRLSLVEEHLLGLTREMDVPGHMAPFLYFQFLKAPKASLVNGVFEHNAEDIKSLVTLYIHLTRLLHGELAQATLEERYECGRWLVSLGFHKEAILSLEPLLEKKGATKGSISNKIMEQVAISYKKLHDYTKATSYFLKLSEDHLSACIEVAKHYEHRESDYEKALFYTQKAYSLFEKTSLDGHELHDEIIHRRTRLETKISAP